MPKHLSQTQLAAYSERALHPDALLAIDSHLASCEGCHERLSRMGVPRVAKPAGESVEEPFHLDYEQHLEPYVDGTANNIDREIVDSHIAECSRCADDLRDLLAFREQPGGAAAITNDASVKSSRGRQWLPQWPWLPIPVSAAAAVIAVFVLGTAVLLWTTYPTQRVQQAESGSPTSEQPAPAPTEQTTPTTSSSRELLFALNDADGQVGVNQGGQLEGFQDLPPDLKESVEKALASRQLRASPALKGWVTGAGNLRSELERQSTFAPLSPTDLVIETDRPTFRWRALEGAQHYVVTIYDAKLRHVASSDPVTGTQWCPPNSLARGVTYSWQISAMKDGTTVVSPKPPLPEARFRILDQPTLAALAQLRRSAGSSHLAMGVFYWKHGLIDESEREFQALAKANPNSTVAAKLLASIRSLRRR